MKQKSYAKVNIFLKITGYSNGYHHLNSRFMKVYSLYDEVEFVDGDFDIIGDFDCAIEQNTIYKAYTLLAQRFKQVREFFANTQIKVTKNIPHQAGLGGGSSNAATFLKMTNKVCKLNLGVDELAQIGAQVGSDVSFFVYDYDVANVYQRGDIIRAYNEEAFDVEVFTPNIQCSTPQVFQTYKKKFFNPQKSDFDKIPSKVLLQTYTNMQLNDLLQPALYLCPKLQDYLSFGYFSGSGSSFFRIKQ
ncbi:MAG: 4-(cytidine 5'-diphospho)-2-C-methyl-D-erythritol kinase [Epsilonproteobacteria bacterium]|nr:4-(cytidine 5'-diphospho)-2-C-methyl-D-erythritol kinase [Campylobacterota bacterium]